MSTAVLVALISGGISLAAATISLLSARNVARLNSELEERQRVRTKREQADELRAQYRDPLLGAVFDLQSRLFNIVAKAFLVHYYNGDDKTSRAYAIENTLYLLAEYLGWVEIMRREIQFLDLGEEVANRRWVATLERVRDTLARDDIDPTLRVFRGEQRAIGELMAVAVEVPERSRPLECRGYASFVVERKARVRALVREARRRSGAPGPKPRRASRALDPAATRARRRTGRTGPRLQPLRGRAAHAPRGQVPVIRSPCGAY